MRPLTSSGQLVTRAFAACLVASAACNTDPTISSANGGARAPSSGRGGGPAGTTIDAATPAPAPAPGFTFQVPDGGAPAAAGVAVGGCTGLCTRRVQCPSGGDTTVSGVVVAPTPPSFGKPDPLYNAVVYVPNGKVEPFPAGVTCEPCTTKVSGSPLTQALTGADGKFVLTNVPAGDDVPLVVQVGRWRRQVVIPHVEPCKNNPLPADLTRLPRNHREGDIPLTAIATGKADALECVLRKIGVDQAEFNAPGGPGRIHIYISNGANLGAGTPTVDVLTSSADALQRYDMALFECEGDPVDRAPAAIQNVLHYADAGGRLFFTHFSYTWLYKATPFQGTATWTPNAKNPTANDAPLTGLVDQSFPKGKAFAQWLQNVGASPRPGQIQINTPRHSLDAATPPAQRWIYSENPATVQHYTFNTPVGSPPEQQCGRALFSDFHVNNIKDISVTFPMECNDAPLTPQEKVLEFMLFDLASCVQPDDKPPALIP